MAARLAAKFIATDEDYLQPFDESDRHDFVPEYDDRKGPDEDSDEHEEEPKYKPLEAVKLTHWDDSDVPKRQWFWDGLFPLYQVSILSAEGGTGKSLLGSQAAAVAAMRRREFLGRKIMGGPTMYLAAEDDEDELKRRFHDIAESEDVDRSTIDDLYLFPMADKDPLLGEPDNKGQMQPTETWLRLVESIKAIQPVVLFLDTAADLFGGDEVKRVQVRQFVAMLRATAITHKVTVVLLYHPSRSGIESGKGESGSTAWFNSVRAAVFMTEEKDESGDLRRIKNTKSNYGKKGKGFVVKWTKGVFKLHDENAPPTPEELKRRNDSDSEFMSRFVEYSSKATNKPLSNGKTSPYFAPKALHKMRSTSFTLVDFVGSMNRLIGDRLDLTSIKENGREREVLTIRSRTEDGARRYGQDD